MTATPHDQVYGASFYQQLRDAAAGSASVVVPLLMQWFAPASVIDVGCAAGTWLAAFGAADVGRLLGLDGPGVGTGDLEVAPDEFRCTDLATPFRLAETFDLALCLEVAEHLPEDRAAGLVADLVALAPAVVFSAAVPHQGGTHHVNEQWPDYWSQLFGAHGYAAVDCLRPLLWADERVSWWYRQNTVVYLAGNAASARRALQDVPRWPGEHPARLVQPQRYLEWAEYAIAESAARWD